VLATKLPTHTQVLNSRVALLADATPAAFSEAMLYLLCDQQLRAELGQAGKQFIEAGYSYTSFRRKVLALFDALEKEVGLDKTTGSAVFTHAQSLRD
jgi:hypothetical protein